MGRPAPDIQIVMPAYKGAEYIHEAIRSIVNQTYPNWVLDVSIDGPDQTMQTIVEDFGDERIHVHTQSERLGWPGNYNWLVEQATLDYVCYWQQDDFAAHDYLEVLRSCLLNRPSAAVAYTDVQWVGDWYGRSALPSIEGLPIQRGLSFLEAIRFEPLRGLMRRSMIESPAIPPTEPSDQMEFVFLTRMAVAGDLVRADGSLYFKRKHMGNAFSAWGEKSHEARQHAWTFMGAAILRVLLDAAPAEFAHRILCLVLDRLCIDRPGRAFWAGPWSSPDEIDIVARELTRSFDRLPPKVTLANEELMHPIDPLIETAVSRLDEIRRIRAETVRNRIYSEDLEPYLVSGWSAVEQWGVWSVGHRATLALHPDPAASAVRCGLIGFAPNDGVCRVRITVQGAEFDIELTDVQQEITIPIRNNPSEAVAIEFVVADPMSPFESLGLPDQRRLGVGLTCLESVVD